MIRNVAPSSTDEGQEKAAAEGSARDYAANPAAQEIVGVSYANAKGRCSCSGPLISLRSAAYALFFFLPPAFASLHGPSLASFAPSFIA